MYLSYLVDGLPERETKVVVLITLLIANLCPPYGYVV